MAKSVEFKEQNALWGGGPASKYGEEVGDLNVHMHGSDSWSCWELDEVELAEIKKTGRVWLRVIGMHPPVYISGRNPFVRTKTLGIPGA